MVARHGLVGAAEGISYLRTVLGAKNVYEWAKKGKLPEGGCLMLYEKNFGPSDPRRKPVSAVVSAGSGRSKVEKQN